MNLLFFVMAAILLTIAYLLGSIPFGYIYSRHRGVDITNVGSGNIGAANIYRQFGFGAALFVFLADMLKGLISVLLAIYFGHSDVLTILAAMMVMLGHSKSIFISFKGGKAVATGLGALIAMLPLVAFILFLIWLIVFGISKITSLSSILAVLAALPVAYLLHVNIYYFCFIIVTGIFVIIRHRENIIRLINGSEKKIFNNK